VEQPGRELPPGLHIIPGASAAGSFREAFGPRDLLLHQDILSFGPCPRSDSVADWISVRDEFLGIEDLRGPNDLARQYERLASEGPIFIWAGTGVEDQLLVALTIDLARKAGRDPGDLQLIQFRERPGSRGMVVGMGELNPSQLTAFPEPVRLAGGLLGDCSRLWDAWTSNSPRALDSFVATNPYVTRAARLLRRRYPRATSGLPFWDFALLRFVRESGPKAARVIGFTMLHEEPQSFDWVSDLYLYEQMHLMADPELNRPLLSMTNYRGPMHENEVRLTEFGNEVLDGAASVHPGNSIDYWAGGVHLSSADGMLWFDDGEKLVPG